MPLSLLDLSNELQLMIISALQDDMSTLRSLTCTCHFYRSALSPYVFKSVTLRNTQNSASSVAAIAAGEHAKHVEELYFKDLVSHHTSSFTIEDIFPAPVHTVLSNLGRFTRLQKLSIEFNFPLEVWWDDASRLDEEETYEEVEKAEVEQSWRAVMAHTYDALAMNTKPVIEELEIIDLPPQEVSTFSSTIFHHFLSHLKRFKLSILGGEMDGWWQTNTVPSYWSFLSRLDRMFFNHLRSVTELSVAASEHGPIGPDGANSSQFALNAIQMPHLRSVHLEYMFVCPDMVAFLACHIDTLEIISLRNCLGVGDALGDFPRWSTLFKALVKGNPKRLRQLSILPIDLPIKLAGEDRDDTEEEYEVRRILANNPTRRLFAYSTLDNTYGFVTHLEHINVSSFLLGEDQEEFDKLMEIVNANAAKLD